MVVVARHRRVLDLLVGDLHLEVVGAALLGDDNLE